MPGLYGNERYMLDRAARVKAKLKRLGINPRGLKYSELFHRWMRAH